MTRHSGFIMKGTSGPNHKKRFRFKHLKDRDKILKDIDAWFETSARIAGLGANIPSYEHRNREAVKGLTGYVGNGIGDKDICYVDERGIAVAEVYKYAIMGAMISGTRYSTYI